MYSYILNYLKTTTFQYDTSRCMCYWGIYCKNSRGPTPISPVKIVLIISKSIRVQVDIGKRPRIVNQVGMCRSVNLYIFMKRGHLLCETLQVLMLGITSCTHTSGANHKLCFNMYTLVNHLLKPNIHAKIAFK
jgi:hypothetical protein